MAKTILNFHFDFLIPPFKDLISIAFLIFRLSVTHQISPPTKAANNKMVKKTRN